MTPRRLAIVFGTYNRLPLLQRAVASVRAAVGALTYEIIVVDGGSTDGSRIWLAEQTDVHPIFQDGPLTGAVRAFNLGFGYAVEQQFDYVAHFNDDAEIVTPGALEQAVAILEGDRGIGEVAFEFDLRGPWDFEYVNGALYANYGVIRREAGMQVAVAQGDPTGRAWWNPIYRTYGADTELGVWLWKLGWRVHPARGLRVHDGNAHDALRDANGGDATRADGRTFWGRWRHERLPRTPVTPPGQAKREPRAPRRRPARGEPKGRLFPRGVRAQVIDLERQSGDLAPTVSAEPRKIIPARRRERGSPKSKRLREG